MALLQTVALTTTILARPFIKPDAARASSTPSLQIAVETALNINYSGYMDNLEKSSPPCRRWPSRRASTLSGLLVSREPDGVAAGELARLMDSRKTRCRRTWPFWRAPVSSVASATAARSSIAPTRTLPRSHAVSAQGLLRRPSRALRAADRRSHALLPTGGVRSWLIACSTSCFSARATPRARSSPKASCAKTARGASAPSRPEATRKARSIRSLSKCSKASIIRPRACARKAGKNLQRRARPKWISCSRSATTRRARPARSGRASR